MLVEGKGKISPSAEIIKLTSSDVEYIRDVAVRRDAFRRYSDRRDTWGKGLVSNPAMCGLLGEHALCVFINRRLNAGLSVDSELRENGDGGRDIEIHGLSIEQKTRVTGKRYLVRRVDDRKHIKPLVSDVVSFAKLVSDYEVWLLGWQTRSQFRQLSQLVASPRGSWWNLDIEERELRPMSQLIEEIKYWRAA